MTDHPSQMPNTLSQCPVCGDYHAPQACPAVKEFVIERIRAFQMKQGSASGAPPMWVMPTTASVTRIPDDDFSVCTLHPARTLIARRLLAFLETEPEG
jgi:hypothetical protein